MNIKKAAPQNGTTQFEHPKNTTLCAGPTVTGQLAQVLNILRQGPVSSLVFAYEHKIMRSSARILELRQKGFNITTQIRQHVQYHGHIYKNTATYALGRPEWSPPFQSASSVTSQSR